MAHDQKYYGAEAASFQQGEYGLVGQKLRDVNPDAFHAVAEQANSRMGDFLLTLSALTDQLCGGVPPASEGTSNSLRSIPSGHFSNAADQCGQIMTKLEQANRLLSRIRDQL